MYLSTGYKALGYIKAHDFSHLENEIVRILKLEDTSYTTVQNNNPEYNRNTMEKCRSHHGDLKCSEKNPTLLSHSYVAIMTTAGSLNSYQMLSVRQNTVQK